jgi:hypothetical protein
LPLAKIRRAATLGIAAAALTATAAFGAGTASASPDSASPNILTSCVPGLVPLTNQNTWVRYGPGFAFATEYTIPAGYGFRILAGPASADGLVWWYGNGNGGDYGWVPDQNLSCH